MFAFALYDRARRKLFLARDGFGIKPLYLRRTARQLSFASEIRALAFDGEGPLSVDPDVHAHVPADRLRAVAGDGVRGRHQDRARDAARDRSRRPARRASRPSTGWRPRAIEETRAGRPARAAARAAERLGAAPPDGRRSDGAFSLGRPRLQRADAVREPARRAAQDVLDRVLVVRSRRRDALRGAGRRAGPATRTSGSISGPPTSTTSIRSSTRSKSRWPTARSCRSGTSAAGPPSTSRWRCRARAATRCSAATPGTSGGPSSTDLRPFLLQARRPGPGRSPAGSPRARWASSTSRAGRPRSPPRSSSTRPARYLAWFDIFTAEERRALVGDGPDGAVARYESLFDAARELRPRSRAAAAVRRLSDHAARQPADEGRQDVDGAQPGGAGPVPVRARWSSSGWGCRRREDRRAARQAPDAPAAAAAIWGPRSPTGRSAASRSRSIAGSASRRPTRCAPSSRRGPLVSELGFDAGAISALIDRHLGGEDIGRKLFALTALERWAQRFVSDAERRVSARTSAW